MRDPRELWGYFKGRDLFESASTLAGSQLTRQAHRRRANIRGVRGTLGCDTIAGRQRRRVELATRCLLKDPGFRRAARHLAEEIAAMPLPDHVGTALDALA